MRRIVVAGCQGSGKSWLARQLGARLALPVVHLDVLYWQPGWRPSDKAGFRARVAEAVAGEGWVVDGSFAGLAMDLTLARADTAVLLERPRLLCQWRILRRSALERGGARPDLPAGCPEQFDWRLMREAWRWERERRPGVEAELARRGGHVALHRLGSDRAVAGFLAGVDAGRRG